MEAFAAMYVDNGDGGEPRGGSRRVGLALLALLGIALLLPGACGILFTVAALWDWNDPYMGAFLVISLPSVLVGAVGVWLLVVVRRKARRPDTAVAPPSGSAGPEGE
ncbi:MAG: hypothetical protein KDC47_09450 [Flavobacteriaceae bacterium]|nr:hypothetical protein [Flavobacteriaceae bacterium]